MRTKYPQGDERQLIYALTGREIPEGKLPADVGCVVFNVETCSAIYRAFAEGMPLIERCVTVDGDCVKEPKNLRVPLGTSVRELISYCGGLVAEPFKIINGGPMMGAAIWDADAPVTKGTSAILVFSKEFAAPHDDFCLHSLRQMRKELPHAPDARLPCAIRDGGQIRRGGKAARYELCRMQHLLVQLPRQCSDSPVHTRGKGCAARKEMI